jgi:hypothetical protein
MFFFPGREGWVRAKPALLTIDLGLLYIYEKLKLLYNLFLYDSL